MSLDQEVQKEVVDRNFAGTAYRELIGLIDPSTVDTTVPGWQHDLALAIQPDLADTAKRINEARLNAGGNGTYSDHELLTSYLARKAAGVDPVGLEGSKEKADSATRALYAAAVIDDIVSDANPEPVVDLTDDPEFDVEIGDALYVPGESDSHNNPTDDDFLNDLIEGEDADEPEYAAPDSAIAGGGASYEIQEEVVRNEDGTFEVKHFVEVPSDQIHNADYAGYQLAGDLGVPVEIREVAPETKAQEPAPAGDVDMMDLSMLYDDNLSPSNEYEMSKAVQSVEGKPESGWLAPETNSSTEPAVSDLSQGLGSVFARHAAGENDYEGLAAQAPEHEINQPDPVPAVPPAPAVPSAA